MARRKAQQEYTNVHGVKFTAQEQKRYVNLIKSANKATKNLYKKLRRLGVGKTYAGRIAGGYLKEDLNIITNKAGAIQKFKGIIRRATVGRVVDQKDVVLDNMLGILEGIMGVDPINIERITAYLKNMTLAQFINWYEINKDLIEEIFDWSPPAGTQLISQDEIDHIVNRLYESFGVVI